MEIIPVLDLLDGHVVRGIGGRRDEYRPIESDLIDSSHALDIAGAFRDRFGLTRLYVADLNAIQHQTPDLATIHGLVDAGFELMVDAGLTRGSWLAKSANPSPDPRMISRTWVSGSGVGGGMCLPSIANTCSTMLLIPSATGLCGE